MGGALSAIIRAPASPLPWPQNIETTAARVVTPALSYYLAYTVIASLIVVFGLSVLGGIAIGLYYAIQKVMAPRQIPHPRADRTRKTKASEEEWDRMEFVSKHVRGIAKPISYIVAVAIKGAGPSKEISNVIEDMETAIETDLRRRPHPTSRLPTSTAPTFDVPAVRSHPIYFTSGFEPGSASEAGDSSLVPSWSGMCAQTKEVPTAAFAKGKAPIVAA